MSPEMARILALTPPEALPALPPALQGRALRAWQEYGLRAWRHACETQTRWGPPGLAVLAGCGTGKTLFSLLLNAIPSAPAPRDTLFLVPASAREQFTADADAWRVRGWPVTPAPAVYSHETLSSIGGQYLLRDSAPALLVIDEAHRFAAPDSARWRRIADYLRLRPDTRLVVLSGSLTYRSLLQYRHLLVAAIRSWSPLPATAEIRYWASVIDADTEPCADDYRALRALSPRDVSREALRDAYRGRLLASPGVVTAPDTTPGGSLTVRVWAPTYPEAPANVRSAVAALRARWELPGGEPLMLATDYARHLRTLALGFFLRIRPETAHEEYLAAARAWAREQRRLVAYEGHRYETPGLVARAAEEGAAPPATLALYRAFCDAAERYPAPETEVEWLPDAETYCVDVVRALCREHGHTPSVVWVASPALGAQLAGVLGVPYCGAGSEPPEGDLAVASWRVHGTGWNTAPARGFRRALVFEPPANGGTWEQLLARLHRSEHDVEYFVFDTHGGETVDVLRKSLVDAEYTAATTGAVPRLLCAAWEGLRVNRVPASVGKRT